MPLASIDAAIAEFQKGKMIIVVDDEDRENEGDLIMAAELVTPEAINFMVKEGRGLVCCSLGSEIINHFGLPLMVPPSENRSGFGTPFTISVEAAHGVTTGISAYDRAHTIRVLMDPQSQRKDIVMPGHVFPLHARDGGVLERDGQTEAGVDMARLSGLRPGAVLCEIMNDDGTMSRRPELELFAKKHGLIIISVEQIQDYRKQLSAGFAAE
ncbi:MAG: 3,4-dihydroxy-2-butanone-4-phosphate synthase [bacterium]